MRLWWHFQVSFPLSISVNPVSPGKLLRIFCFEDFLLTRQEKQPWGILFSFTSFWLTAVLITGEIKPWGEKGKKSTTHRTLLSSHGAFKCKFLHKMVKTKKKRKPWGSIYYIKELSLSYVFQNFPSGTSKFFNTHQIHFLNNCFKRSSVDLNRKLLYFVISYGAALLRIYYFSLQCTVELGSGI